MIRDASDTTMRVTSWLATASPSMRTLSRPTSRCSWPHDTLHRAKGEWRRERAFRKCHERAEELGI
jgi:hypothetical protein